MKTKEKAQHTPIICGGCQGRADDGHACAIRSGFLCDCTICNVPPEDQDPQPQMFDDSVKFCPNCERPNQFGELCVSCEQDQCELDAKESAAIQKAEWRS